MPEMHQHRLGIETGTDDAEMDMDRMYIETHKEYLKEQLQGVEDIPQGEYAVMNGAVFVRRKLMDLIDASANALEISGNLNINVVRELAINAWVTPYSAIHHWNIMPYPYRIAHCWTQDDSTGWWVIQNEVFDATLPGKFKDRHGAEMALAQVLSGTPLKGPGDFEFQGQHMTLNKEAASRRLPTPPWHPESVSWASSDHEIEGYLDNMEYEPDCPLFDEQQFKKLQHLERLGHGFHQQVLYTLSQDFEALWSFVPKLSLDRINEPQTKLEDNQANAARHMRVCYPELGQLNIATLMSYYDAFHQRYMHESPKEFDTYQRSNDFLVYLVGHNAGQSRQINETMMTGRYALFMLSCGQNEVEAYRLAREWHQFRQHVSQLAFQSRQAVDWIINARFESTCGR